MSDLAGACDTHTHIFPIDDFPFAFATSYSPPRADVGDHMTMLDAVGLTYGVIVQPGVYGTDPAALMDALARSGGLLRGVAAMNGDTVVATLRALHAGGVRGLRFTEVRDPVTGGRYRGTVGLDALDTLAPDMRSTGLHAQLWSPLADILVNADRLRACGLPVVIDHMAMVDAAAGPQQPGFGQLLDLLDEGWMWVKLSLCRVSKAPGHGDIRPFHDALVTRAPDRMLWASDWPFVRMDPVPDARSLLARFMEWVPDRETRTAILVDNPGRLYGFKMMETAQ